MRRLEMRHEATYLDLAVMEVLDQNSPINLPSLIIKHMAMAVDQEKGIHALPYEFLLTRVCGHFKVPLRGPKNGTKKDMFDEETLKKFDCIARSSGTKSKGMVTNLLEELNSTTEEKETMKEKIASFKEENRKMKQEIKKEQEVVAARFDKLLGLINGEPSSRKEPGLQSF